MDVSEEKRRDMHSRGKECRGEGVSMLQRYTALRFTAS